MRIDQRNAGASATAINVYTVDRWHYQASQASKVTWQQNAGAVTPPVGFTDYLGLTSSSAYSVLAGDYFRFYQVIEGYNIADLGWGTASAKAITLSFQVYSSLTGTFGGSLSTGGAQSYPFTYSIPTANTWTTISLTIAGATGGTWGSTNNAGIYVGFSLGAGATFSGTAGAWASANYVSATGATSVVGTSGATFYVTGVQLEKGSTATDFEYVDYGRQLQMCQRYYYRIFPAAGNKLLLSAGSFFTGSASSLSGNFPVSMRVAPSALEQSGTAGNYLVNQAGFGGAACTSVPIFAASTVDSFQVVGTSTGLTFSAGYPSTFYTSSPTGANAFLGWSAEL